VILRVFPRFDETPQDFQAAQARNFESNSFLYQGYQFYRHPSVVSLCYFSQDSLGPLPSVFRHLPIGFIDAKETLTRVSIAEGHYDGSKVGLPGASCTVWYSPVSEAYTAGYSIDLVAALHLKVLSGEMQPTEQLTKESLAARIRQSR